MHDELTAVDIQKMQEELDWRDTELRAKLIEDVQTARAFGDLSENFEYKAAKQAKNRNESRIRYLKRMIATAVVIKPESRSDEAGVFDRVTLYMEDEGEVAKAVLGHKVGDRVFIGVGDGGYWAEIRRIEKGEDDASLDISPY